MPGTTGMARRRQRSQGPSPTWAKWPEPRHGLTLRGQALKGMASAAGKASRQAASPCRVLAVPQILDDQVSQRKVVIVGWGERAE